MMVFPYHQQFHKKLINSFSCTVKAVGYVFSSIPLTFTSREFKDLKAPSVYCAEPHFYLPLCCVSGFSSSLSLGGNIVREKILCLCGWGWRGIVTWPCRVRVGLRAQVLLIETFRQVFTMPWLHLYWVSWILEFSRVCFSKPYVPSTPPTSLFQVLSLTFLHSCK